MISRDNDTEFDDSQRFLQDELGPSFEWKPWLEHNIKRALRSDGFDLGRLEFKFVEGKAHPWFEINTTDKETIEAIMSTLFTEVLSHGVTIERFSGCGCAMIMINPDVRSGVIEEMNADELEPFDSPLNPTPTFVWPAKHLGPVGLDEADFEPQ
jgi:hypothetical protein